MHRLPGAGRGRRECVVVATDERTDVEEEGVAESGVSSLTASLEHCRGGFIKINYSTFILST